VVPVGPRYVGCYDGSASAAENYEERCGVAASADLRHWKRLSTGRPWVFSPFGTGSVRYLDVLAVDGTWWIYYEMSRADAAHDLTPPRPDGIARAASAEGVGGVPRPTPGLPLSGHP